MAVTEEEVLSAALSHVPSLPFGLPFGRPLLSLLLNFHFGCGKPCLLEIAISPGMQRVAFPEGYFLSGLDAFFSSPSWHAEAGFQLGHMNSMYRLPGLG